MKLLIVSALAQAYTLLCILGQIRIIRGLQASQEEFPYQARVEVTLVMGGVRHGGASFIAANWLLTAAHFVYGAFEADVYFGSTSRSVVHGSTQMVRTRLIYVHRYFNETTLENDIALIKIRAVTLTTRIGIVKLPKMNAVYFDYLGRMVNSSGWGYIGNSARNSDNLEYTPLMVLSTESCLNSVADQSGMLCAEGWYLPCAGDSGGPMVFKNTQIGIISRSSSPGCQVGFPGNFTRVTHYLEWIKEESGVFYE